MENSLKIYIQKRPLSQWLAIYLFAFPLFINIFTNTFKLPGALKYTADLVWVILLAMFLFRKSIYIEKKLFTFFVFSVTWFLYVLIIYIFNFQTPLYFLWGVRNNFRFYAAFFIFAILLDEELVRSCLKFMDILFWVNAGISMLQFFVFGHRQDFLGGIFGSEMGSETSSIIFFTIVLAKSILLYLNHSEKAWLCFTKCGIALAISAMAELKFFFVVFLIIVIMSMVLTKFSFKKLGIFIIMAITIFISSVIIENLFGEANRISFDNIISFITAENYSSKNDLGRFTAIPRIQEMFLKDIPGRLFGMGLGNCDTSSFKICNTPFFVQNSYLHYNWFSSAILFLETGYIGLLLNISFFVICGIQAHNLRKRGQSRPLLCNISIIMSVLCIMLTFYNASLRANIGYLAFFALAIPFSVKDNVNQN